jgi:spore coat protein U-like protein
MTPDMDGTMSLRPQRSTHLALTALAIIGACASMLAATACRAASPQDLTDLSLDQLMNLELPASSQTTHFQISATAVDSCNVSAFDLGFGRYDPLQATPADQTTTVSVTCTLDVTYIIGLNAGAGAGATVATRKMTSGSGTLDYSLYRDGSRTTVWGNTAGTDTVSGVGTGIAADYTVYGRINAKQPIRAGTYQDTITVSIYY